MDNNKVSAADAAKKTASVTGRPGGTAAGAGAPEHDPAARPRSAKLINAPYISQRGAYPTGCESVSTVMLLKYLGYKLSVDDFIGECLEIKDFEERDGILYGPDPRRYFCGDPYSEDGMGCYAPVIVKALNKAFETFSCERADSAAAPDGTALYKAADETGRPLDELISEYIENDMPVIFWACINMREPVIGPEWLLTDYAGDGGTDDEFINKEFTDKKFTWVSNEHCMLLVGYDEKGCWFNDPYDGNGVIRYPWDTVRARHAAQHSMAVGVKRTEVKCGDFNSETIAAMSDTEYSFRYSDVEEALEELKK